MIDKKLLQLPGIKKILMLLAGSAVLQAIFIIGQAYGLSMTITHLWNGENLNNQINWMLLFFASFALRHLMTYLREHVLEEYAYQQAKDLRSQLLQKIFHLGPQVVQKQGTGSVVTTALDGIDQVEEYLHLILPKMLNDHSVDFISGDFSVGLGIWCGLIDRLSIDHYFHDYLGLCGAKQGRQTIQGLPSIIEPLY